MISPAGAEGISLNNVRQVHIMEPYWHEVRITQMNGRAIRHCSHKDLPLNERHVDIYRYKSVRNTSKITSDQFKENIARSKDGLIQSFCDAMKEVAVDCQLYKAHNMMRNEYKCFQFDEPSLFDEQVGPAYKDDIHDDIKTNNGLNSTNSSVMRIKVIKIKSVGGVIRPGDPIMEVVPTNDQLLVEAKIRPADIAFIHPEQEAMVKITAYDFSVYGGLKGEVVDISPDSITNEKGESFYHIRVRTYETELKRKGEILPIIPGMVASVDILTGHKTIMEYILKPYIKTVDSAMRER
jgi:hypothetical protein